MAIIGLVSGPHSRETVESDNAKALVNFAEDRGAHVMAVNSQHLPVSKARKLQGLSAKEFRGVASVLFALQWSAADAAGESITRALAFSTVRR